MSTEHQTTDREWRDLQEALENAESAIMELEGLGAFQSSWERSLFRDDDHDTDEQIDEYAIALETALDVIADLMSTRIAPHDDEAFTIDEILARHVRSGVVEPPAVKTAASLAECLGTTSSAGLSGLDLGEYVDAASLYHLHQALKDLARHLYPESSL